MKHIKNTLSFYIPLCVMLISFTLYLLSTNMVSNYKQNIIEDYSIVIVTNTPFEKDKYTSVAGIDIERIETLQRENIINSMNESLSKNSIDLLKQKLPHFYKIYLSVFPTTNELQEITKTLEADKTIKKVESFSKNHNQVFELLILIENITAILFILLLVFAILIISKQMKIWFYEHFEKISIMKLHGASTIYSASPIINYTLFAALLAFLTSALFFYSVVTNLNTILPYNLDDLTPSFTLEFELVKIFVLSFSISIATIFGVLLSYSFKQR